MNTGFIYKNVYLYRIVMNVLYSFTYKKRFYDVVKEFSENDKNILDLCFGDIIIASECKRLGIQWMGIDMNENFVSFARKKGYNAVQNDITKIETLPLSDICIMVGSLYHFHNEICLIIDKMLASSRRIIISEPIINLSSNEGFIGKISRRFTNAGKGAENFRFNKKSIIEALDTLKIKRNFEYRIISINRDILIEINKK
jgi:hypothetical protein